MIENDLSPLQSAVRVEVDVEVRYAETDQMGVVHHAGYIVWFEVARTRLCLESGFSYAQIEEHGYALAVTGVDVTYRKGARYGETVRVAAWIEQLASRRMRFAYEVTREVDMLATGHTTHMWVNKATGTTCRTPEFLKGPFDRLTGVLGSSM